jgi:hypothetical protein
MTSGPLSSSDLSLANLSRFQSRSSRLCLRKRNSIGVLREGFPISGALQRSSGKPHPGLFLLARASGGSRLVATASQNRLSIKGIRTRRLRQTIADSGS